MSTVDSYPVAGAVAIRDAAKFDDVDLGKRLVGQQVFAAVEITNSTGVSISIEHLKTSCGCAAAVVAKDELLDGETTKLLVRVTPRNPGKFTAEIMFHTELGWHRFNLRMDVFPAVDVVEKAIYVSEDAQHADIDVVFHDTEVDSSSVKLFLGGGTIAARLDVDSFRLPLSTLSSSGDQSRFIGVFTVGEKQIGSSELTITRKGRLRVAPNTVYYNAGDSPDAKTTKFRLFVLGDCSAIEENPSAILVVDDNEIASVVSTKRYGKSVEFTFTVDRSMTGTHSCQLRLNGKNCPFTLEPR